MPAMIKPPARPLALDFEKARQWIAFQERQLTKRQALAYGELKERQARAREALKDKREDARKALKDHDAKGPGKPTLALNPPGRVPDAERSRLAQYAIALDREHEKLVTGQHEERFTALKAFEAERESGKEAKSEFESSWARAVGYAARQEADRGHELSHDLGRDVDSPR
jgi:hypothetical protein